MAILTARLSPSKLGRVWEVIVRNYFVEQGYVLFRCYGSGPPCDLIAFYPPFQFEQLPFPQEPITRSERLESEVRLDLIERYHYQLEVVPRVYNGLYKKDRRFTSVIVHLIALAPDHLRLIWVRPRSKTHSKRIWMRKLTDIVQLTFIECKAGKSIDPKQQQLQLQYAQKVHADYVVIQRTLKGALVHRYFSSGSKEPPEKLIPGKYIIEWDKLMLGD